MGYFYHRDWGSFYIVLARGSLVRRVIEIQHIEPRTDTKGKPYFRTHVLLDDGTEAVYWGTDIAVDNLVEVAFHKSMIKAIKP